MKRRIRNLGMPLAALCLSILPFVLLALQGPIGYRMSAITILFIVCMPIAGVVMGFSSLGEGRSQIGIVGVVISLVAVALPIITVVSGVLFFAGAATGVIRLM